MARLLEYQANHFPCCFGVPAPEGRVVRALVEALEAAAKAGYPAMAKAQVQAGDLLHG